MSTSTPSAPSTPTVAGVEVLTVKIPGDRGQALALYAKVKTECDAAYGSVQSAKGDKYEPTMKAWLSAYKYPRMALWNRVAMIHQGGQGLTGQNSDPFRAWVARNS